MQYQQNVPIMQDLLCICEYISEVFYKGQISMIIYCSILHKYSYNTECVHPKLKMYLNTLS